MADSSSSSSSGPSGRRVGKQRDADEGTRPPRSRSQRASRGNDDFDSLAPHLASSLSLSSDGSSASTSSSHDDNAPWGTHRGWVKHESFIHALDQLDDADGFEDFDMDIGGGVDGAPGRQADRAAPATTTEEAQKKARRQRRRLIRYKRRLAERRVQQGEEASRTGPGQSNSPRRRASNETSDAFDDDDGDDKGRADALDKDVQHRLSAPSPGQDDGTQDIELRHGSLRLGGGSTTPPDDASASFSSSSLHVGQESFYDALSASPEQPRQLLPLSSMRGSDPAIKARDGSTREHTAARPNATASSSTLRQDASPSTGLCPEPRRSLHHQDSASTIVGSDDGKRSAHSASRTSLPPPRPTPTLPLPLPPRAEQPTTSTSTSLPASPRKLMSALPPLPQDAQQVQQKQKLGPNDTIRGRPRGATVGAVPGRRADVRQRVRPRSLLSQELTAEELAAAATSFRSPSASRKDEEAPADRSWSSTSSALQSSSVPWSSSVGANGSRSAPMTQTPSSTSASMTSSSAPSAGGNGAENGSSSSNKHSQGTGTRSRSGSNTSLLQQVQLRTRPRASFVIAVVGHRGSGKSTVIKKGLRQFGLSKPQPISDKITSHSTVCIVDHEQRTIEVLEVDALVLLPGSTKRFAWPKFLPRIDAAILCYDASHAASFRGMSELLENFAMNHLSTVMLACKSEIDPKEVDPYNASDMASVYNVGLAECSVQSEEGKKRMRDCFSYLVKEVAKARASGRFADEASAGDATLTQEILLAASTDSDRDSSAPLPPSTSASTSPFSKPSIADSPRQHHRRRRRAQQRTFSDGTAGSGEEDNALQKSINRAQLGLQSAKSAGGYVSIEELYDKLFFAAVSGNDERFLLMFMTFFRGFAQPVELLRQIVARFDALARGEESDGIMIRYSLMKLTTMLGDWMQEYPGDLSSAEVYGLLQDFFGRIMQHGSTRHVAAPMQQLLAIVRDAPDLDAAWSRNQDNDKPSSVAADVPPVRPPAMRNRSSSPSTSHHAPRSSAGTSGGASTRSDGGSASGPEVVARGAPEMPPVIGRPRSASDLTHSSDDHNSPGSVSGSSGVAPSIAANAASSTASLPGTRALTPHQLSENERKSILRNVSRTLFEIKDEVIAHELTRIEWDLFAAVGPRDLLRHILVSRQLRSSESPVAQSIAHFNYVSGWVCSMILVQSKTKQRARMLEKFIEIAGILRRINNYNTLHAVLAGLGNASIHRLRHTRELLNGKRVFKTYQSLTRLMGSDRSFAAYRLALDNSEGRTIPYLGVHLQDILSTSDGNPSKRASDGAIHWRKFSLMYDAVMAIVRCQEYQMPLQPNAGIAKLILDLPILGEDAMYQRSLQVEPRQSANNTSTPGSRIIRNLFHVET